jgi:hypothetical protein
MLNKMTGFGLALFSTILFFILFKLLIHDQTDINIILAGVGLVILYGSLFIFIGVLLSFALDNLKISRKSVNVLVYFLLGIFISQIVIWGVGFYRELDLTIFFLVTCSIGSVLFYLGKLITNKILIYFFAVVVPVVSLIFINLI